jgi:cytochrome c556
MNLRSVTLVSIASACLASTSVMAQQAQQPSPEQMKQIMQATMGAMVSVMGPMTEAVLEAQLNSAAKPETAERIATSRRIYMRPC